MLRATCRDLQMDLPISVSEQSLWWMGGTRRRWGAMDLRGTSRLSTQHDGYLLNADIQGQQHEAAAVNAVRKLVQTPWQSLKQQNKRIGNRKKNENQVFLCKIHSANFLHVILAPPPQQVLSGLLKGFKKGKKAETFQSGKGYVSQRDERGMAHPEQRVTAQPWDQCIHSSSRQTFPHDL